MKKAIAISMLMLLAVVQTPLAEIFKFPLLCGHFMQHREQDDISLIDFLVEHYSGDHNDDDLNEDEKLPFKSITHLYMAAAVVSPWVRSDLPPQNDRPVKNERLKSLKPDRHPYDIFHPPRI